MFKKFGFLSVALLSVNSFSALPQVPEQCWTDATRVSIRDGAFEVAVDANNLSLEQFADVVNRIQTASSGGFFTVRGLPSFYGKTYSITIQGTQFSSEPPESRAAYKDRVNAAVKEIAKISGVTVFCELLPVLHPAGSGSNRR